jgi:phosphate transport system ATP-binding protein
MNPKLEARAVTVSYNGRPAISELSLAFEQSLVTALLGPSGCGKSTLLWALNRLHDLTPGARVSGRVLLDGGDIYAPGVDVLALRRRVGLIFQRPNPFPFSIEENIAFALREHGVPRRELGGRVEEALRAAALWEEVKDRLKKPAAALSGGQQQRLCIARAIALSPEVLLMDEPCAALDPLATAKIEELILGLRGRYTLVVVTHNLAQARRISDRAACFWVRDGVGVLAEEAPTVALFDAPRSPEVRDYIQGRAG